MENSVSQESDRLREFEEIVLTEIKVCKICFARYIMEHMERHDEKNDKVKYAMLSNLEGKILNTHAEGVWYCPCCESVLYDENLP